MHPNLRAVILLIVLAAAGYGIYFGYNHYSNPAAKIQAEEFSIEGEIRKVEGNSITIEIEELNRAGEVFRSKNIIGITDENTQFSAVDASTTPFTITAASLADFEPGQRVVLYTNQNPYQFSSFNVFKAELLPQ